MKKILWTSLGVVLLAVACGQRTDGSNDAGTQTATIQGTWVSEGADVAPLLAGSPFGFQRLTATFGTGSYTVVGTTDAGTTVNLEGTYVTEQTATPGVQEITLNQNQPNAVTSEGIFQIDSSTTPVSMKYEVVQTSPSTGATPPSPAAGFGSTNGGNLGQNNVQKFKKQ